MIQYDDGPLFPGEALVCTRPDGACQTTPILPGVDREDHFGVPITGLEQQGYLIEQAPGCLGTCGQPDVDTDGQVFMGAVVVKGLNGLPARSTPHQVSVDGQGNTSITPKY